MKKTIAVDCREFYKGKMTGIGRLLANFLVRAPRERGDWEFLLLGTQDTEFPFPAGSNLKIEIVKEGNTQVWDQFLVPALLRRKKCDLYFSPYPKTCLFTGVPSITTIHDLTGFIYPGYRGGGAFLRSLTRLYAKKASAILTDSVNSRNDIVKFLGVGPEKIFVTHGSVDGAVFRKVPDDGGVRAKYGINGQYILYVGNSNPHKNLDGLVKAYGGLSAGLREKYPLVLAGVGDYRPGPGVTAIKRVPDCDLPPLYSNAALLVFPSFYEGFGLPPLEAMACGCPVASSAASCLPEILGDACVYFNPASPEEIAAAVSAVLENTGLRAELAAKGLERVKLYEPGKVCSAILKVFDRVLR